MENKLLHAASEPVLPTNEQGESEISAGTGLSPGSVSVMRNHKDTVFRLLFNRKKELLSLYNALNGTSYTDEEALQVETLENAIYIGVKDDVAFILDSRLNIYEQQASFNPNMPLRDLLYIAAHFSGFLADESIYSSRLVKIPTPQFLVLYNGVQKQPERRILKLSDSYMCKTDDPQLELKVLMLNINEGYNEELLENCRPLKEYCIFVNTVRRNSKLYPLAEAVNRAVDECIENDVLREFLSSQRAEVVRMSIFEFDVEKEIKKLRRSEYNYGRDVGREEGAAGIIQICQKLGQSKVDTVEQIVSSLHTTEEQAREYLSKYWAEEMPEN